jgi:iron complex transport system substrate-binding protein
MKKTISRVLAAVLPLIIVLGLAGCDNADYTEYGGVITSLDAAGMSAARESYVESSVLADIEKEDEEIMSYDRIGDPISLALPRTVIDREGNTAVIPEDVQTIISPSPSVSEILIGLGLSDKIVAADVDSAGVAGIVSEFCTLDFRESDADGEPVFDIEQLIAYDADLVIISDTALWDGGEPFDILRDMGAAVVFVPESQTIEGIKLDIEFLGAMTGTNVAAAELISEINTAVMDVREAVAGLPLPTVYFETLTEDAHITYGKGTLVNELIEIAGGENIFSIADGVLESSDETVRQASPDFIIITSKNGEATEESVTSRAGYDSITAVKNGNVFPVSVYDGVRSSQNVVGLLREIAEVIHPEAFR